MSEYQKLKLVFPKEEEKKREFHEIQIVLPKEDEKKMEFREVPIVFVEKDKMGEQEITLVIET